MRSHAGRGSSAVVAGDGDTHDVHGSDAAYGPHPVPTRETAEMWGGQCEAAVPLLSPRRLVSGGQGSVTQARPSDRGPHGPICRR